MPTDSQFLPLPHQQDLNKELSVDCVTRYEDRDLTSVDARKEIADGACALSESASTPLPSFTSTQSFSEEVPHEDTINQIKSSGAERESMCDGTDLDNSLNTSTMGQDLESKHKDHLDKLHEVGQLSEDTERLTNPVDDSTLPDVGEDHVTVTLELETDGDSPSGSQDAADIVQSSDTAGME